MACVMKLLHNLVAAEWKLWYRLLDGKSEKSPCNGWEWSLTMLFAVENLLKSMKMYYVLSTFKERLLFLHQSAPLPTCSVYAEMSLLLMRPTTVTSSANLMTWFALSSAVQSWVSSVKSGLSTQPCGMPVVLMVLVLIRSGLSVRKARSSKSSLLTGCLGPACSSLRLLWGKMVLNA